MNPFDYKTEVRQKRLHVNGMAVQISLWPPEKRKGTTHWVILFLP